MDGPIGQRDPKAIAIVEAALILEAGAAKHFDRLLVVTCRPEQRAERWAARTKVSLEAARLEVARRMAAQLPDEEKIKAADYVIDNSGSLDETKAKVGLSTRKLQAEAWMRHGKGTSCTRADEIDSALAAEASRQCFLARKEFTISIDPCKSSG